MIPSRRRCSPRSLQSSTRSGARSSSACSSKRSSSRPPCASTPPAAKASGLCLFDESWHQGVVGLVAGRIKDRLNRPVIAFARTEEGSLRGSARSVSGINIRDVLDGIAARHPGLIEKFGGHAMAAGMTLREASFEEFRAAFAARNSGAHRRRCALGHPLHRRRAVRRRALARDGARAAQRRSLGAGISRAGLRRRIPHRGRAHRRRQAPQAAASRQRRGGRSGSSMRLPSATSAARSSTPRSDRVPLYGSPTGWN